VTVIGEGGNLNFKKITMVEKGNLKKPFFCGRGEARSGGL